MAEKSVPPAVLAHRELSDWVDLSTTGVVFLRTGKVELGQGILTALTQIAADELGVAPDAVRFRPASTEGPNEGATVGSLSVEIGGKAIQLVTARLRALLTEIGSKKLGVAPAELAVSAGELFHLGRRTDFSYWTCLSPDVLRTNIVTDAVPGTVPLMSNAEIVVGKSVPRVDLDSKLRGKGFIHDMELPGMLHGRVVRGEQPFSNLVEVREEAFRDRCPNASVIRREGFLACVSADEEDAIHGAVVLSSLARWSSPDTPADVGDDINAWLVSQPHTVTAIKQLPAGAEEGSNDLVLLKRAYTRPFLSHASIGLSCGVAVFDGTRLRVWSHSQNIFALRDQIAVTLSLQKSDVCVEHRPGAGCYGHNGADDVALDAAVLAHCFKGRPVRVQWSRRDEMNHAPFGAAMAVKLAVGINAHGKISRWTTDICSTTHVGRPGFQGNVNLLAAYELKSDLGSPGCIDAPESMGGGATRNATPIYDFAADEIILRTVSPSPVRTSSLRSLGAHLNVFAIESMMDECADQLQEDPIEFRLRHLSDPRAIEVLKRVAMLSHWHTPREADRALGVGFARYKGRSAYCAVVVEIELGVDIRAIKAWCAVDAGAVVSPIGAASQIEGGIVQSLSWTCRERVLFNQGVPSSVDWNAYPVLRFSEAPDIEVEFLTGSEHSVGVGEASQGPAAAAIGNAVARALGVRLYDLPLDREAIVKAIS